MFPWDKREQRPISYHRVTREEIERNQRKQRENDYRIQDFEIYNKGDSNIRVAEQIEKNAEYKRRRSQYETISSENLQDQRGREIRFESKQNSMFAEQEKLLAEELARERIKEQMKEREIQRICEEDDELRELQERLKVMEWQYILDSIYKQGKKLPSEREASIKPTGEGKRIPRISRDREQEEAGLNKRQAEAGDAEDEAAGGQKADRRADIRKGGAEDGGSRKSKDENK